MKLIIRQESNTRIGLFFSVFLVLLSGWQVFAAEPAIGKTELKTLLSWDLSEPDFALVKIGGQELKFFPQSFFVRGDEVQLINRHDPYIFKYSLKTPNVPVPVKLMHEKDKKFDARFFIDLGPADKGTYCLEQSTASLRRAGENGKIDEMFMITEKEGAIISKFWRVGEGKFCFYDEGLKKIYLRNFSNSLNETPDKSGTEIEIGQGLPMVDASGIMKIESKASDSWECAWRPLIGEAAFLPAITWSAESVVLLDSNGAGKFYFYSETGSGAQINVISKSENGFSKVDFAVEKLSFPTEATRVCKVIDNEKILFLVSEEKKISLKECRLMQ